ncbi:hypothetical protein, partial [Bacteroides intestinalis]|uniref:hypothetical protein n=1 Tax=Bacteroides intestinalis TaxID=329854 RepID=UPI0005CAB598
CPYVLNSPVKLLTEICLYAAAAIFPVNLLNLDRCLREKHKVASSRKYRNGILLFNVKRLDEIESITPTSKAMKFVQNQPMSTLSMSDDLLNSS